MIMQKHHDLRFRQIHLDFHTSPAIPGIGKARAQSIITYRQEHGEFATIEDIKKVSGIKDGLFQKIKDKIRV